MDILGATCLCGHGRFDHWWEVTKGSYCLECPRLGNVCNEWREMVLADEVLPDDEPPLAQ